MLNFNNMNIKFESPEVSKTASLSFSVEINGFTLSGSVSKHFSRLNGFTYEFDWSMCSPEWMYFSHDEQRKIACDILNASKSKLDELI